LVLVTKRWGKSDEELILKISSWKGTRGEKEATDVKDGEEKLTGK